MFGRYPSMRMRIALVLIVFALIPTATAGIILRWSVLRGERERGLLAINQAMGLISGDLEALVLRAESTADALVQDNGLRAASKALEAGVSLSEELDYFFDIRDRVNLARLSGDFRGVRIFLPGAKLLTSERMLIFPLTELDPELSLALEQDGWTGPWTPAAAWNWESYGTSGYAPIVSYCYMGSYGRKYGNHIVAIDIAIATLADILGVGGIEGRFEVVDRQGQVLAARGEAGTGEQMQAEARVGAWRVRASIPMAQFGANSGEQIALIVLGTLVVGCLFVPLLASVTGRQLSRGIPELARASERAVEGSYEEVRVDGRSGEVRKLQAAYNGMIKRIDTLIHDVYEAHIAQQEAQMNSLFEQIKPHFLYNTLECGKWMALANGDKPTAVFMEKLAQLFRLSLSRGENFVTLRQELRHAELYVELMVYRTEHAVAYQREVDESLEDLRVMKLILQPLVENAIEHGILQTRAQTGTVTIRAQRAGELLELIVEDDGTGFPPQLLGEVTESAEAGGYGTKNVLRRLRLSFGARSGLWFENRAQGGARVRLRFPVDWRRETEA